jgi:hypothetical protein
MKRKLKIKPIYEYGCNGRLQTKRFTRLSHTGKCTQTKIVGGLWQKKRGRKSQLSSLGQLTHTRRTDGAPEPDGALRTVPRAKIRHYRQLYINRPEPIGFMPVAADTTGRIYEDFSRLLFLHAHREASALGNELPEESEQFRFLRAACFANIKGSVGLILTKVSDMRISIPLDLSSRTFIPLPRFMRSRRVTPLIAPSLVFSPRRFA